jgi:protein-disulfide isomerase
MAAPGEPSLRSLNRIRARVPGLGARAILCWVALALLLIGCGGSTPPPRQPAPAEVDLAQASTQAASIDPADVPVGKPLAGEALSKIPVESDDAVWGKSTAPVTLVAFLDFQCPFCARAEATVETLRKQYGPDQLRVVVKHYPLPFHQDALPAALAAQSVRDIAGNEAFFAYASLLYGNQRSLGEASLEQMAEQVGVDRSRFESTFRSDRVRQQVAADIDLANKIGVEGTPNFRINGTELEGAQPIDQFKQIIDHEIAASAALLKRGVPANEVYARRVVANYTAPKPRAAHADVPVEDTTVYKVPVGKSPVLGPAGALVTIVEFADFQCPFCKRADETLKEVLKRYPGKVRLVFKHKPLPFHNRALPAAMLAIEAQKEQGSKGFWKAHDLLFESNPHLDDADLLDIAKKLQLSTRRAKAAIANKKYQAITQADSDLADGIGVRGTPSFFINGRKLVGAQPLDSFTALIDQQLSAAEALVKDKHVPAARVYDTIMKDAQGPKPPAQKSVPAATKANPSQGPARAPVVVQMFADFQCPFCKRVLPTIDALKKAFPGKIRVVWRNLPLPFHPHAHEDAAAAMEAFAQRGNVGFWKMHDLIYKNQGTPDGLSRPALEKYAKSIGLDVARFDKALDSGAHDAEIDHDAAVAAQGGIRGTPGFVINGYYVSGAQPLSSFKRAVHFALDDLKHGKKPPRP